MTAASVGAATLGALPVEFQPAAPTPGYEERLLELTWDTSMVLYRVLVEVIVVPGLLSWKMVDI